MEFRGNRDVGRGRGGGGGHGVEGGGAAEGGAGAAGEAFGKGGAFGAEADFAEGGGLVDAGDDGRGLSALGGFEVADGVRDTVEPGGLDCGIQEEGLGGRLGGEVAVEHVHGFGGTVELEQEVEVEADGLGVAREAGTVADEPDKGLLGEVAHECAKGAVEEGGRVAGADALGGTELPDRVEDVAVLEEEGRAKVAVLDAVAVLREVEKHGAALCPGGLAGSEALQEPCVPVGGAGKVCKEFIAGGRGDGPRMSHSSPPRLLRGQGLEGGRTAVGTGAPVFVGPVPLEAFGCADEDKEHGKGADGDGQCHARKTGKWIGLQSEAIGGLLAPVGVSTVRYRLAGSGGGLRRGWVVGGNVHEDGMIATARGIASCFPGRGLRPVRGLGGGGLRGGGGLFRGRGRGRQEGRRGLRP